MRADNEELVRRAYRAFNDRDIEAAAALMDPYIEWPNLPDGGVLHGRDEVKEHWREQFDKVDPRIEVVDIREAPDGSVEARVRQIVRTREGEELSEDSLIHVFTIAGDRIQRLEVELQNGERQ